MIKFHKHKKTAIPRRPLSIYEVVRKRIPFYIYLLPLLFMVILFGFWPIIKSIILSFTDSYTALSNQPKYIGFQNFATVFKDSYFYNSMFITLKFTFIAVPINIALAFILALALDSNSLRVGRMVYKVAIFIPVVTSDLVVAIIWRWMYQKDFGTVNALLNVLRIPPFAGLSSPDTVIASLIIVALWKNVGIYTVIFLTNLQLIEKSLYEVSDIDGANYLQKIRYIVIPGVRPALMLNSVYAIIQYLKVFTLARIMTNGGPNYSSNFLAYYAYDKFSQSQYGEATSMATILFLIVITLFALTIWLNRRASE